MLNINIARCLCFQTNTQCLAPGLRADANEENGKCNWFSDLRGKMCLLWWIACPSDILAQFIISFSREIDLVWCIRYELLMSLTLYNVHVHCVFTGADENQNCRHK